MTETVHIRGENGAIFEMSLPLSPPIADRLHRGYLTRVNADGSPRVETESRRRPYSNEPKAEWVSWAAHNGMKPDDADALTKQDLIERFGV